MKYIYVCSKCKMSLPIPGFCTRDGSPMAPEPAPKCPNGHYIYPLAQDLPPNYCGECGAKIARRT